MKNFLVFSPLLCFFLLEPLLGGLAAEITEEVEALIFILSPGPAVLDEVEEQFEEVDAGEAGREDEVELEDRSMEPGAAAKTG